MNISLGKKIAIEIGPAGHRRKFSIEDMIHALLRMPLGRSVATGEAGSFAKATHSDETGQIKKTAAPISFEKLNSNLISFFANEESAQKNLLERANKELIEYKYAESTMLFEKFASQQLSGTRHLWAKRNDVVSDIGFAFMMAVLSGPDLKRRIKSIAKIEKALHQVKRFGDLFVVATLQRTLGVSYRMLFDKEKRNPQKKYLERAIAANRSALEFFTFNEYPNEWDMTQYNLASSLFDLARANRDIHAWKLFTEAAHIFRTLAKFSKGESRREASISWGDSLLERFRWGLHLRDETDLRRSLQEAETAVKKQSELISRKKFPNLWLQSRNVLGRTLLYRAAYTILYGKSPSKLGIAGRYFKKSQNIFENALKHTTEKTSVSDRAVLEKNLALASSGLIYKKGRKKSDLDI